MGEFGLEPHQLGEYAPGHVFCFWKPTAAKELFLGRGFPFLPGLGKHDHTFK